VTTHRDEADKQLLGAGLVLNVAGIGANVGLGAGRRSLRGSTTTAAEAITA